MQRQEKNNVLLLVAILIIATSSCNYSNNIQGQWTNSERDIIFTENTFEIRFYNSNEIIGFRGIPVYKSNVIELIFFEYKDKNGEWYSLMETELENYKERIRFRIKQDELETYIENTGKIYRYRKT